MFTLTQHCEETDVATDAVTNDGHSELTLAAFSTVLTILTFTLPMSSVSALRKQQQHFTSAEEKQLCRDVRTVWLALYLSLKSKSKNLKTWRNDNIDY